jgi:AAA domain (dynein-related subfamily)
MALAASLLPGFQYEITGGPLEGEVVTIVDNTPFPDGDSEGRQRKITCLDPEGREFYILPRLLGNNPVGMAGAPAAPVAAPVTATVQDLSHEVQGGDPSGIVVTMPVIDVRSGVQLVNPITDPMDPRLDHFRPSKSVVKRYMNREMPASAGKSLTDIEFLLTFTNDDYRAENDGRPANIMLKGDTQSGKTLAVEVLAVEWAKQMGYDKPMPIFTLSGSSGVTDYDLFGQTTSYTDPTTGIECLVWLPGLADLAAQCGGILYLDEVNAMGERVTSSLHPLADSRHHFVNRNKAVSRGGTIMPEIVSAHMDLWIIGTYNEGYRGMGELNEAFINRFRHIRWGYDANVELKLIKSAAVRLLGDALRTSRQKNALRTPIGTAALQKLERDIETFGPVMGLEVLIGMFKMGEQDIVSSIIEDRSIIVLLNEEQRQRRIEDRQRGGD